jgi:hypothetical protein
VQMMPHDRYNAKATGKIDLQQPVRPLVAF